jgi:hypothetical protein
MFIILKSNKKRLQGSGNKQPEKLINTNLKKISPLIRIRKSKKNRQHNGQKKKNNRTNNDLQNIHLKLNIGCVEKLLISIKFILINFGNGFVHKINSYMWKSN